MPGAMPEDGTISPHLSDVEAAAYVDGRLSPAERERADEHLEGCAACRHEVIEVANVVAPSRPAPSRPAVARPRRRLLVPGLGLAAAALAVLLVRPWAGVARGRDQLRDAGPVAETEGVPRIAVVRPAQGDTIGEGDRALAWRSAGADATYRLTVGDAAGRVLWRATTGDTTLAVPDSVFLRPGSTYFWHVDALLPTGLSATTRVQRFTVRHP